MNIVHKYRNTDVPLTTNQDAAMKVVTRENLELLLMFNGGLDPVFEIELDVKGLPRLGRTCFQLPVQVLEVAQLHEFLCTWLKFQKRLEPPMKTFFIPNSLFL
jgi:hypothetical protein